MYYDLGKLTVDQLAEEIQQVMEDQGWLTLGDIVDLLELEDSASIELVRQALRWMYERSMLERGATFGRRVFRLTV